MTINPYDPPETIQPTNDVIQTRRLRLWPLLLLNFAFLLSAILVVIIPSLRNWLVASILIYLSVGGWTLARHLQQSSMQI